MSLKEVVTFLTEDGEKVEFEVVEEIELEGSKYVLLAPIGEESEDAYVYKVVANGEKEELIAVEDDAEFDRVMDAYENSFDE
ncbi:MAG: DUF1292 domain-containing protein [Clostridiaceae bacterium]